jgi:hypothetical protein
MDGGMLYPVPHRLERLWKNVVCFRSTRCYRCSDIEGSLSHVTTGKKRFYRTAYRAMEELEDHLREQIESLRKPGLTDEEAFLVAVKKMGALDALSHKFAREHSDRLWKQLVALPDETGNRKEWSRADAIAAFGFAVLAAMMVKLPAMFGIHVQEDDMFYARSMSLFVLPLLTGYFILKRGLGVRSLLLPATVFTSAFPSMNLFLFHSQGYTEVLSVLHLPVALWFIVGIAYAGERWRETAARMNFILFSGEFFVYYVLIALGGGIFTVLLVMMFETIGLKPEWFIQNWLIPCGAAGTVILASWLVEAKQSVIENMAPVLTRLFTPLFAILLVIFLATLLVSRRGINIEREVLIAFDLLLIVVLALLLYAISAPDPHIAPGFFRRHAGCPGGECPAGRRSGVVGYFCAHHGVRIQSQSCCRSRREHYSAGESRMVCRSLYGRQITFRCSGLCGTRRLEEYGGSRERSLLASVHRRGHARNDETPWGHPSGSYLKQEPLNLSELNLAPRAGLEPASRQESG